MGRLLICLSFQTGNDSGKYATGTRNGIVDGREKLSDDLSDKFVLRRHFGESVNLGLVESFAKIIETTNKLEGWMSFSEFG